MPAQGASSADASRRALRQTLAIVLGPMADNGSILNALGRVLHARQPMRGAGLLCALPNSGALPVALKTLRRTPRTFFRILSHASLWPMVEDPAHAGHLFLDREADADEIAAFHARLSDESFMSFLDMTALALPRLPRKAPPVCVVGGELDQIFPPVSQRELAHRFRTTATIITNGPHDLMLSRRWRASAQAFLDWLHTLP